ncbi:MAG: MOSC N-terminal beta barrel domain-containing protein [Acidobacteriota bacterium]
MNVSLIQLHPIKGLDPVSVDNALVLPSGALEFDRRWAMLDARGRFVNGKNRQQIHSLRARFDIPRLEVALEGKAFSLLREGDAIARWFSERLGDPLEWRENADTGFPDDLVSPGPTFVSQASLAKVAEWFGLPVEQTRRRFRANIEFAPSEAFWEDRLYGRIFRAGEVEIEAVNPCERCVVPSRDPFTGAQDTGFQKRFAELRQAQLPTWANAAAFKHFYRFTVNTRIAPVHAGRIIRVGDDVSV